MPLALHENDDCVAHHVSVVFLVAEMELQGVRFSPFSIFLFGISWWWDLFPLRYRLRDTPDQDHIHDPNDSDTL